ncbi:MAG TPA: ABC transporter permease [Spirochaetia bacterium]|nr:ABC transporter permease [Spirochaetia bacterium]
MADEPRTNALSIRRRVRNRVAHAFTLPGVGAFTALVLACIYFSFNSQEFLTGHNFSLILQQSMVIGVEAIGQTLIILTAGIDLSNGTVMAFGSVIMTGLAVNSGVPPFIALIIGFLVTMGFGLLNGALVTQIRLPPFIVTLGVLNITRALTLIYTLSIITGLPPLMTAAGNTFNIGPTGVTYGSVLMVILYLVMYFVLKETAWGRHVYAIGNNPEAVRLAGISKTRLLLSVYGLAGLFYGIAGLLLVARTGVGDPQAGLNDNLSSITAVVLGGTSLFGGRGNILGTLAGALIISAFNNGLALMGVQEIVQVLITGVLVILAVSVDQMSHRGLE